MLLRVVTWNLQKSSRALPYLFAELRPTVALLQESPAEIGGEGSIGLRDVRIQADIPRLRDVLLHASYSAATLAVDGYAVRFISLYSRPLRGKSWSSALSELFEELRVELERAPDSFVVLGGDFNASTQLVGHGKRCGKVLDSLVSLGFVDALRNNPRGRPGPETCQCGSAPSCMHIPTLRKSNKGAHTFFQIDNIFVSRPLAGFLEDVYVVEPDDDWNLSDHRPVVADLKLTG